MRLAALLLSAAALHLHAQTASPAPAKAPAKKAAAPAKKVSADPPRLGQVGRGDQALRRKDRLGYSARIPDLATTSAIRARSARTIFANGSAGTA